MNLKNYFEYKKDSLSSEKSEFFNVLNKIEIDNKIHKSKISSFEFIGKSIKYFASGAITASAIYVFLFYFVLQNKDNTASLVIRDTDIKVEYLDNAINTLDDSANNFK